VNAEADTILAHAIGHLPEEFQNAACVFQWSSSMAIKAGIRVHLWFWLDRPVSDGEAKAWLASAPIDAAIYDPVQVHITANPAVDEGVEDPVHRRVGVYRPQGADETVAVPDDLSHRNPTAPRRRPTPRPAALSTAGNGCSS
jgi:hypothetical protein